MSSPVVLTIAGSDPSGGAGIQADLKTFAAHGCYGTSAITALTAQNTLGVQGVHPCPPEFIVKQIESLFDDLSVSAIKTGMLFNADTVKAVVECLKARASSVPLVCDPVCVSTSGHRLLQEEALDFLLHGLFPLSTVITPNKSEAELLLSRLETPRTLESLEDVVAGAQDLLAAGCEAVLLKGGHLTSHILDVYRAQQKVENTKVIMQNLPSDNMEILHGSAYDISTVQLVVDVLHQKSGQTTMFVRPRIESTSTHGTGCTLSSAIASEMAKGLILEKAVERATMYTHNGIQEAQPIGNGHGPLNHFHNMAHRLIPRSSPSNPYPFTNRLIEQNSDEWKKYVQHEFVVQLGKGTLPRDNFIHFIRQDYIYLKYYARAYSLLAAKSSTFEEIGDATKTILNVLHEVGNHKAYCAKFGITAEELERTPEAAATTAYGAFIIDTGLQGDTAKLIMALMACLLGYGEVGLWLKKQSQGADSFVVLNGNPYLHWMEEYSGKMYQDAVQLGLKTIENIALSDPPSESRLKEWIAVWERCTRLEKGFWDMAMNLAC